MGIQALSTRGSQGLTLEILGSPPQELGSFPGKPGYLLEVFWEKPAQQDAGASLRSRGALTSACQILTKEEAQPTVSGPCSLTWMRAMFPVIIRQSSLGVSMCPMLAWETEDKGLEL